MCRSNTGTNANRLINVGELDDFSDLKLEIRPQSGWRDFRYAVLSHTWGGALSSCLTTENLLNFQDKIPFGQLPQTFKDTIIATRRLNVQFNVRYLWIDALCIIQNSKQDWENEAPKMGSIYRNAFLGFAATFGKNGETGLFRNRNPLSLRPCIVQANWNYKGGLFFCEDRAAVENMLDNSALGRRGWVLQERIFLRRVLHFSCQQLFWECSTTMAASEAYPNGLFESRQLFQSKAFSVDTWKWSPGHRRAGKAPNHDPYDIWSSIVSAYSMTSLKYCSDKLVAIGSLAIQLQRHFGSRDAYAAGLWKAQFPAQLLWKVYSTARKSTTASRPKPYRAPTWSWASVEGKIYSLPANGSYKTKLAKVLSIDISYTKRNIALGVDHAVLRLRGLINLFDLQASLSQMPSHQTLWDVSIKFRIPNAILPTEDACCKFDTTRGYLTKNPVYAVAILASTLFYEVKWHGLLLERVQDQKGHYRRCGWFEIGGRNATDMFSDMAKSLNLNENDYEIGNTGDGMYTIAIL
jgi:hypothetical protein